MKKADQDSWADFEVFTSKGAKIKDPKITITDQSTFLFNAAFIHIADFKEKTHVVLGYSPSKRIITFDFTADSKAQGALKIVHKGGAASVGSRSFFNFFFLAGPDSNVPGTYVPKKIKIPRIGDVWHINLNNKLPVK